MRFAAHALRSVCERQHYGFQHEEPTPEGEAIMTYGVDTFQELMPWLLGWGAAAAALDPPELRNAQPDQAARLLAILT